MNADGSEQRNLTQNRRWDDSQVRLVARAEVAASSARPPPARAPRSAGSSLPDLRDGVVARERRRRDSHFKQRRQRSQFGLDASGNKRLPAVGQHDHVARLEVRRGVLDQTEVVAGRVVEAVAGIWA